jgi:hypothetical protein
MRRSRPSNKSVRNALVSGQVLYPSSPASRKGAEMSSGSDNAKAEIRAAVGYLLKDAPGGDRGEIVWQVIAIVNQVARALPGGLNPLEDGMPGG